jgi:hypothetical protein
MEINKGHETADPSLEQKESNDHILKLCAHKPCQCNDLYHLYITV